VTVDESDWLAERFEENRPRLLAVAYRVLGSPSEADDAVQEAWLRLSRSDASAIENLGGWLTTVVGRVCLDMFRPRRSRREEPMGVHGTEPIAFVLHDMFAVPFNEIAPIVGRSPTAARQLASRARRRVQGAATSPDADLTRQRAVVDAFLAASRGGDFDALLALLDPDVMLRADRAAVDAGATSEVRGAAAVAGTFAGRARFAQPALVNGAVGAVWAPGGRPRVVFGFTITGGKTVEVNILADPARLRQLHLAVLDDRH
jgi:RNA polymerase sigma-70 factor (ECF subfamily)